MKKFVLVTYLGASALYLGSVGTAPAQAASAALAGLPTGAVAMVNGIPISQKQLDDAVRASRQLDTPSLRQAMKGQLIARELFRQDAEKAHYDMRPEVQQLVSAAKVDAETELYVKDNVHPEPVTDAQVKARYDEIVASLGTQEFKPRIITVGNAGTAKTVLNALRSGTSFDALARHYSTAPSKGNGGELPWISFKVPAAEGKTGGLPFPVAQALTQLPVGGITSAAIPVGHGRVIVKLDAMRPTQTPTFDQAKDMIREQLEAQALQRASAEFTAGLLQHARILQ